MGSEWYSFNGKDEEEFWPVTTLETRLRKEKSKPK
jgi:hypothetical protein